MDINHINNRTVMRILGIICGFAGVLVLAWIVRQQLVWIITAAFLAIALNPMVSWLSRRMPKQSRGLAIAAVFLTLTLILGFLVIALLPPLFTQSKELVTSLPHLVARLRDGNNVIGESIRYYHVIDRLNSQASQAVQSLSSVGGSVLGLIGMVFGSVLATLTILVLTYFMLIEGPGIVERLWSYHPTPSKVRNQQLVMKMYASVTGYVTGNALTSLICGVVTWVFLTIAGLPYALPIALIVAILDLIPMVGASLGAVVGVLVALSQSITLGIITLVFFIIYQQVENNFLQPYVYGKTIQISPLAVFISAMLGVGLGGLLGALVAVPVGASIAIVAREVLNNRRGKALKKA